MKTRFTFAILFAAFLFGQERAAVANEMTLPLAGTWQFGLDAEDVGVAEDWFARDFEDTVHLPGTTDENPWKTCLLPGNPEMLEPPG